jgi:hypothetical protein
VCKSRGHKATDSPKKSKSGNGGEVVDVVVVEAVVTKEGASSWEHHATNVESSGTRRGAFGN